MLTVPRGKHTYGPEPEIIGIPQMGLGSRIGSFCAISYGLRFIFLGDHLLHWCSTYPFFRFYEEWGVDVDTKGIYVKGKYFPNKEEAFPIVVGNDVWIGSEVNIKAGVNIGDGAAIAFGSLVTKDVPPYALVGGWPAEVIRYRFTPEQIEKLLRIQWWNWEDAKIKLALPYMMTSDIDGFIEYAESTSERERGLNPSSRR